VKVFGALQAQNVQLGNRSIRAEGLETDRSAASGLIFRQSISSTVHATIRFHRD
jgi:hypothetical protein